MGRGSDNPKRQLFFCSLQTKDDKKQPDVRFELETRKTAGGPVVSDGRENELSGQFLKLAVSKYDWKGITNHTVQVWFYDKEQEFKLEINVDSNLGRGLINKLISTPHLGWLVFRCYSKKAKEGSDVYPQLYIENNGVAMDWKFQYETQLKPMIETYYDRKTQKDEKDYAKVNALLLEHWHKHMAVVNPAAAAANSKAAPTDTTGRPAAETQTLQQELDNMPDPRDRDNAAPPDYLMPDNSAGDDLPF